MAQAFQMGQSLRLAGSRPGGEPARRVEVSSLGNVFERLATALAPKWKAQGELVEAIPNLYEFQALVRDVIRRTRPALLGNMFSFIRFKTTGYWTNTRPIYLIALRVDEEQAPTFNGQPVISGEVLYVGRGYIQTSPGVDYMMLVDQVSM